MAFGSVTPASGFMECCGPPCRNMPEAPPILSFASPSIPKQVKDGSLMGLNSALDLALSEAEPSTITKGLIARWLLQLDDASMLDMLEELLRERPRLSASLADGPRRTVPESKGEFARVDQSTQFPEPLAKGENGPSDKVDRFISNVSSASSFASEASMVVVNNNTYTLPTLPSIETLKKPTLPTLQFSAPIYYASEGDGVAVVEVIRIAAASLIAGMGNAVVHWETADGSAEAGKKYVAAKGKIEFGPSSAFQEIRIEIIDDANWDGTLDFFVVLLQEGIQNAELPSSPVKCRVKIIDDDCFPSNRFREKLMQDKVEDISSLHLVQEYFKVHLRSKVMTRGIKKALGTDLLHNVIYLFLLVLKVWMINNLLMPAVQKGDGALEGSQLMWLIGVGLMNLVPFFFMHYLTYRRNCWKLVGAPLKLLQANLMRKVMAYPPAVRKKVDHGEIVLVLFKEIPDVVLNIYGGIFPIFKAVTLLMFLLLYQTIGTRLLGLKTGELAPVAINVGILLLFPIMSFVTLRARHIAMTKSMNAVKKAEHDCTMYTIDMLNNYNLLADYMNRGTAVGNFEKSIDRYNSVWRDHRCRETNNLFIPRSLSLTLSAFWICVGGLLVTSGYIEMGTFLAEWDIIQKIGLCWQDIFEDLLKIQTTLAELTHIIRLMNYPTDLQEQKDFMTLCSQHGHQIAASQIKEIPNDVIAVDQLPIRLSQLSHSFGDVKAISNVTMDFQQGKLHIVAGRRDSGKTTLLELIGRRMLVQMTEKQGFLFVPQQLVSLHISAEPLFFAGTLYDNLTYGLKEGDKNGNIQRVLRICRGMNIMEKTLALISDSSSAYVALWNEELSYSDRHILHIVRGLVANPEVLCIHKPSLGMGANTLPSVMNALKIFVALRGLEQDPESFLFRRPRTCICTSSTPADLEWGDLVHRPFEKGVAHQAPGTSAE